MAAEAGAGAPQRFLSLDALRGFAAIAVALYHYHPAFLPGAYLAVDFFFALSGFVLVNSYRHRFEAGLTAWHFIRIRMIRMYPLHLAGVAIGVCFAMQRVIRHAPDHMKLAEFLSALLLNPLMLPSPLSTSLFPLNFPAWSLFFEMLSNIAMALILIRLRLRTLLTIALAAAVVLVVVASMVPGAAGVERVAKSGLEGGADWVTFQIGLARVAFSFTVGMVLAMLPVAVMRGQSVWALPCCALLLILLGLPVGGETRLAYDLGVVCIASPLLIYVCSRFEPPRLFARVAHVVGDISFPLYATHGTLAMLFRSVETKAHLVAGALAPVYLGAALALGWVCYRWVDKPARRFLGRQGGVMTPSALSKAPDGVVSSPLTVTR